MQEQMITAVPLKNWVVVFTKKDRPRAYEFVNMVKKVSPPLGMVISEPQVRKAAEKKGLFGVAHCRVIGILYTCMDTHKCTYVHMYMCICSGLNCLSTLCVASLKPHWIA